MGTDYNTFTKIAPPPTAMTISPPQFDDHSVFQLTDIAL